MITREHLIDALQMAVDIIHDKLPDQPGLITLHDVLEKAKADETQKRKEPSETHQ